MVAAAPASLGGPFLLAQPKPTHTGARASAGPLRD